MSTELEDRLRADMRRFAADLRVPPGLARRAYLHRRKRRTMLRALTASGAAAVLAASAIAVAGVTGAFGPATARPAVPALPPATASLTAYVLRHVEGALAPTRVDNLVGYTRMVFPPGFALEPSPGGIAGPRGPRAADAQWSIGYTTRWQYGDAVKLSAYSPGAQHVFDFGVASSRGSATVTAVLYGSRTWWTAPVEPSAPPAAPGCAHPGEIQLSTGAGNGWPPFIRTQLACGVFSVVGHQVVDGIDAIKIAGPVSAFTLWVNPATYLPVQMTIGPLDAYFRWLPPTAASLAPLRLSVPAGFRRVAPPGQG
jgi:hypothetical protein